MVGGSALLGVADNVSYNHPVNHALEAPLITGGIFAILLGLTFILVGLFGEEL